MAAYEAAEVQRKHSRDDYNDSISNTEVDS
jgi:hypothetical protein